MIVAESLLEEQGSTLEEDGKRKGLLQEHWVTGTRTAMGITNLGLPCLSNS